ncbi:hypothetical protein HHI36_009389 [Cryptolaemus montrouzieri]|uniref:Uncharacterized protein n=1 Tax=Cryptolaemus montrouzieri TaxID=559131 RepID=A0ABD2MW37_9CUCU
MVLRFLIRLLANNEQLVQKLKSGISGNMYGVYDFDENAQYHQGGVKYYSPTELSRICRQNPDLNNVRENEYYFKRIKHGDMSEQEKYHRKHMSTRPQLNEQEEFRRHEKKEKKKHKRDHFKELPTYEQYYTMMHLQKDQKEKEKIENRK